MPRTQPREPDANVHTHAQKGLTVINTHHVPTHSDQTTDHEMSWSCWCQPRVIQQPSGYVIKHRHLLHPNRPATDPRPVDLSDLTASAPKQTEVTGSSPVIISEL
jgi:hypothetical protein